MPDNSIHLDEGVTKMESHMETASVRPGSLADVVTHELSRFRSHWVWFLVLGILLASAGAAAIVLPPVTVGTTFAATIFLGVLLMVGGVATVVSAFWIGR